MNTKAEVAVMHYWQKNAMLHGAIHTCTNCGEWDKKKETCGKWKARPPADTIVLGCNEWWLDIPF